MKKLLIIALILILGCTKEKIEVPTPEPDLSRIVKYEVFCNPVTNEDCVFLIYNIDGKNFIEDTIYTKNWNIEFTAMKGQAVYLCAISQSDNASITGNIYCDNSIIQTQTNTGEYAVIQLRDTLK